MHAQYSKGIHHQGHKGTRRKEEISYVFLRVLCGKRSYWWSREIVSCQVFVLITIPSFSNSRVYL